MRLTRYTDYALRVLTYLGAQPDRVCSIALRTRASPGTASSKMGRTCSAQSAAQAATRRRSSMLSVCGETTTGS